MAQSSKTDNSASPIGNDATDAAIERMFTTQLSRRGFLRNGVGAAATAMLGGISVVGCGGGDSGGGNPTKRTLATTLSQQGANLQTVAGDAPYQQFSLQTRTALHETNDAWEFAVAGNRDLFAIKKSGTDSGTTEIHVLSADSGYQQFSLQTRTALHETNDVWEFAVAGNRDLFAIKKSGTDSGTTEVHVLSAASGYQKFSLQTRTALHETNNVWEFAVAENRDLFAIAKNGTGSGTTEIHVLSADSGYQQFSLHTRTALATLGDAQNTWAFALAPNRDMFVLKKSGTDSGTTEVHALSAASGYQKFSLQTRTALHETAATWAFAVAENRDVFAIKKSATDSGTTEVHVLRSGILSLDIAKKFAPTLVFHPNEPFLPCSVEHLLKNGELKVHTTLQIQDQYTFSDSGQEVNFPALAVFHGRLWMAYADVTRQLFISSSADGINWGSAASVPGQFTATPALAALNDMLWMVYTDSSSSQLWVTCTNDGVNWQPARQIQGQNTSIPALTVFNGALWMTYSDAHSSQLWVTTSADGWNWQQARRIDGQNTSIPALTAFNGALWMTYSDANSSQLWVTTSADGWNWQPARQIQGQNTSIPALTVFNGALWMTYSDAHSSQLWVTTSADGWNWQQARRIDGQNSHTPAIAAFANRLCMVYPDAVGSPIPDDKFKYLLWASRSTDGWSWNPPPAILAPTQETLAAHASPDFYLEINESQYPGEGLNAPMYYAVRQFDDFTEITYVFLFAYNGHQTVNALRVGSEFKCILDNYAGHQGDLESVTIRISNGDTPTIQNVCFEAHGDPSYYDPQQVKYANVNSVLVHSSLNAHGCYNRSARDWRWFTDVDWISEHRQPGVVDIGDQLGDGNVWKPSELRRIGLDGDGNPVNGQLWAKFGGRLGGHTNSSLHGARYFDGSGLNSLDWAFIKLDGSIAQALGLIPAEKRSGDGPWGPGGRLYIRPGTRPT